MYLGRDNITSSKRIKNKDIVIDLNYGFYGKINKNNDTRKTKVVHKH